MLAEEVSSPVLTLDMTRGQRLLSVIFA